MSEKTRINPETGVIEKSQDNLILPGETWKPVTNENGRNERINTETGEVEERHENWIVPGERWKPKES